MHCSRLLKCFVEMTTYLPSCLFRGTLQASHSSHSAVSNLAVLLKTRNLWDHFQELLHKCWHEPAASGQHGKAEALVRTSWSAARVHERASMGVWHYGRCYSQSQFGTCLQVTKTPVNTKGDTSEVNTNLTNAGLAFKSSTTLFRQTLLLLLELRG